MTSGAEPARIGGQQPDLGTFVRLMAFAALSLLRRRMRVADFFPAVRMALGAEGVALIAQQLFPAVCRYMGAMAFEAAVMSQGLVQAAAALDGNLLLLNFKSFELMAFETETGCAQPGHAAMVAGVRRVALAAFAFGRRGMGSGSGGRQGFGFMAILAEYGTFLLPGEGRGRGCRLVAVGAVSGSYRFMYELFEQTAIGG